MKKYSLLLSLIVGAVLATTANAALKCTDLTGTWHGAPPPYDSVTLDLGDYYGRDVSGYIQFKKGGLSDGDPGLEATCQPLPDGTVKVAFHDSVPGLGTADLYITLLSPRVLELKGHVWTYPRFNGKLTKS